MLRLALIPQSGTRAALSMTSPPLNKINLPLNFMRFFKTLRYFVASTFAARL
jgi:hypothetical protein